MFTAPPTSIASVVNTLLVRGAPIPSCFSCKIHWVNSTSVLPDGCVGGSNTNHGDYQHPFKSIAGAISAVGSTVSPSGAVVANRGDIIACMPGHVEPAITAANGLVIPAGTYVIGLGQGSMRAALSFTNTTATLKLSANSALINVVGTTNTTSIVSPIVLGGSGCLLDIEWTDTTSHEAISLVTCAASGYSDCQLNVLYHGLTTSSVCLTPLKLNGVSNCKIVLDFYGKAGTAVVNFVTTACTNVEISGRVYNAAGLASQVVDTITGSTYSASYLDDELGLTVTGSSVVPITAASTTPSLAAGTTFIVKKTITSSALTSTPVALTNASSGGVVYISDVICNADSTGLAGSTNLTLACANTKGSAVFFSTAITGLGANGNIDLLNASTTHHKAMLESGDVINVAGTGSNGTGAGTVDVYFVCVRGAAGATLS